MSVNINADTSNGLVMTPDTSGEIKLQSAGATIATVDSSGITLATGKDLTLSSTALDASASGIYLGGTTSANLLDDYEEGTWTPTAVSGFTLGTVYNANYIKIGNLVYVSGRMQVTCSAGSGTIQIGGLPFAPTYSNGVLEQGNTNFDFEGGSVNVTSSITLSHNLTTNTRTISPSAIYEVI